MSNKAVIKKITQAELDVMDVLWANSPLAASDVISRLDGDKDWNSRTIKTLLSRLVDKGALSTSQDGRRFLYSPLISRDSYTCSASTRFVDRLFGGRATPLIAQLAKGPGLTDEDIADLEALIKELKS